MRKVLLFFSLTTCIAMHGQTPITLNNTHMPGNNDTLRYTNILVTSLGNYTQTGINFNWNFSHVTSLTEGVRSFKNAFQTPYAFFFLKPNEFGEKVADTIGMGPFAITKYYNYYQKQTNPAAFIADGVGMTFNSIPFPCYYSDKDELYKFPMTFPKYDSTTFRFSSTTPSSIPVSYSKTGYRVTKVDGWGVISTPNGTAACLRLITTQYSQDTLKTGFFPIGLPNVQRSYQWLTTTSKIPYFEVSGALTAGIFTPNMARYRGFDKKLPTLIEETSAKHDLNLYPHPVKDKFHITGFDGGTLTISDVTGRTVLVKNDFTTGSLIDISALPSGIYILNLNSSKGTQSVRLQKE